MSSQKLPPPFNRLGTNEQIMRKLGTGENLFIQGNPTAGLFWLASGIIDLKRTTKTGHVVLIHRARPESTFAEASLFSNAYHCTATATTEAVVIECTRAAIVALLDTDLEFTKSMMSRFAFQIQDNRRRVELLSIRSADERILTALNDGLLIEDISSFSETISLAPETVYRTLARLCQNGQIIKTARGQYRLSTR